MSNVYCTHNPQIGNKIRIHYIYSIYVTKQFTVGLHHLFRPIYRCTIPMYCNRTIRICHNFRSGPFLKKGPVSTVLAIGFWFGLSSGIGTYFTVRSDLSTNILPTDSKILMFWRTKTFTKASFTYFTHNSSVEHIVCDDLSVALSTTSNSRQIVICNILYSFQDDYEEYIPIQ